jgi:hypothetical protein
MGLGSSPPPASFTFAVAKVDAVPYRGGSGGDVFQYSEGLGSEEVEAFMEYLASQQDRSALDRNADLEKVELVDRRLWSLVGYLQSRSRGPSLLYHLFVEIPSVAPQRRAP